MHRLRAPLPSILRTAFAGALVFGCSDGASGPHENSLDPLLHVPRTDTAGDCLANCDASTPSIPLQTGDGWTWGDVTTYGGVGDSAPSSGGACNYGSTGITRYAAIQVDHVPGDVAGQWDGGRICGQCFEVSARTPDGWRTTTVRIVDKCPDAFCGIDLGGAPATDLMGDRAGRYSGRWRMVPCAGREGVSDGPVGLHVKEGSNAWWSLVQLRNPPSSVLGIRIAAERAPFRWDTLTWATEAENFWKVPASASGDSLPYRLEAWFGDSARFSIAIPSGGFARAGSTFVVP